MIRRGVRCLLFLVAVSCSGQSSAPAFAEGTSSPTAASRGGSTEPSEGGSTGSDDPASCLTASARAQKAWLTSANRTLDERLALLNRCAPGGVWTRQEHFAQTLKFAPDGTLAESYGLRTSMRDCTSVRCVAKAMEGVRVDAPPPGSDALIGFGVVVEPKLSARRPKANEYPVLPKDVTYCSPDADAQKNSGRLPPEEIQSIVRSHYGQFRTCYEQGLARTRTLTGRIDTRFVIERDGSVGEVSASDNTLPDCKVVECVLSVYPKLKFPAPSGGIVTVIYPIMLEPG